MLYLRYPRLCQSLIYTRVFVYFSFSLNCWLGGLRAITSKPSTWENRGSIITMGLVSSHIDLNQSLVDVKKMSIISPSCSLSLSHTHTHTNQWCICQYITTRFSYKRRGWIFDPPKRKEKDYLSQILELPQTISYDLFYCGSVRLTRSRQHDMWDASLTMQCTQPRCFIAATLGWTEISKIRGPNSIGLSRETK